MNSNQLVYINPKKYYLVYKTINLINNFIYIGVHATNKLEDNYLGSGTNILKAIKEFGKENFKREILFFCNSKEEMLQKEKELVNLDFIKRCDTYNMVIGGSEWNTLGMIHSQESREKMSKAKKKRIVSQETKEKMSNIRKNMSEEKKKEIYEKISEANKKRIVSQETREKLVNSAKKRLPVSQETREKISNSLKGKLLGKNKTKEHCKHISEGKKNKVGKKHSEETKRKIGESSKGRIKIVTEKTKNLMREINLGSKFLIKEGIKKKFRKEEIQNAFLEGWLELKNL